MSEKATTPTEVRLSTSGSDFMVEFEPPLPKEHYPVAKTDLCQPYRAGLNEDKTSISSLTYIGGSFAFRMTERPAAFREFIEQTIMPRLENASLNPEVVKI